MKVGLLDTGMGCIVYTFVHLVICKCADCIEWWFDMYADVCSEASYILRQSVQARGQFCVRSLLAHRGAEINVSSQDNTR